MKRNKEKEKPLESILELLIIYCLDKRAEERRIKYNQMNSRMKSNRHQLAFTGTEVFSKRTDNENSVREINILENDDDDDVIEFNSRLDNMNKIQDHNTRSNMQKSSEAFQDVIVDDVEDLEENFEYSLLKKPVINKNFQKGVELPVAEMMRLKQLLFGTQTGNFSDEWKLQNLQFSDHPSLKYGLVQHKGGPCGVLASLQSFIIKELLFPTNRQPIGLNPTEVEQDEVLCSSISQILWRAGQKERAVVAINSGRLFSLNNISQKGFCFESLKLFHCNSFQSLEECVRNNLAAFKHEFMSGCIAFLCSAILSKGIDNIRSEMDEPEGRLLGVHGYCTQEVVNLLLTGHSISNVFDGTVELDSGGTEKMILHGISAPSPIGFLSLFEHYQSCIVGKNFKNPLFPIWVVCSESHFSVLFNRNLNLAQSNKAPLHFELMFYDGLARQDSEIKLEIDLTKSAPKISENDLVSPLEHCIRTKWNNAVISWIGCDPLL